MATDEDADPVPVTETEADEGAVGVAFRVALDLLATLRRLVVLDPRAAALVPFELPPLPEPVPDSPVSALRVQ